MQFFYHNENYGFSAGFSYEVQKKSDSLFEETGQETVKTGQETVKTGQETVKTGQETEETGQETVKTGQETDQEIVDPKILSLVRIIKNQTFTVKEIMSGLGLNSRDNLRKNYLLPAIADGYLAMLYPNVPKHRKQAYYLTEKGLSACFDKA